MSMWDYVNSNPSLRAEYDKLIYNPDYEDQDCYGNEPAGLTNSGNKDSDRRSIGGDLFELGFEAGIEFARGHSTGTKLTPAQKILARPRKKR